MTPLTYDKIISIQVKKVYKDGDLRVSVDGQMWTLNPLVVSVVPNQQPDTNNTAQGGREDREGPLAGLLMSLQLPSAETGNLDKAVNDAAQGRLDLLREFVLKDPGKIDSMSSGKSCLQVLKKFIHNLGHLQLAVLGCMPSRSQRPRGISPGSGRWRLGP